jgi:hypothetical protein
MRRLDLRNVLNVRSSVRRARGAAVHMLQSLPTLSLGRGRGVGYTERRIGTVAIAGDEG